MNPFRDIYLQKIRQPLLTESTGHDRQYPSKFAYPNWDTQYALHDYHHHDYGDGDPYDDESYAGKKHFEKGRSDGEQGIPHKIVSRKYNKQNEYSVGHSFGLYKYGYMRERAGKGIDPRHAKHEAYIAGHRNAKHDEPFGHPGYRNPVIKNNEYTHSHKEIENMWDDEDLKQHNRDYIDDKNNSDYKNPDKRPRRRWTR